MDQQQTAFKDQIKALIREHRFEEAEQRLAEYAGRYKAGEEYYLFQAIIGMERGDIEKAQLALETARQMAPQRFEVLFLLGQLHEMQEDYSESLLYYRQARGVATEAQLETLRTAAAGIVPSDSDEQRTKLAVLVQAGFDQFVTDMIGELRRFYEVRKVVVSDLNEVETAMEWADICWFEWCDDVIIHASNLEIARHKPIICRLHRYEAFTNMPARVQWENVDVLMLVTDHLITLLRSSVPGIEERVRIEVVHNGVDIDRYPFVSRSPGFNLASVGYVHMRKNPMLLLQILAKLVRFSPRYKLHVAGKFQDPLVHLYWEHMVREMGLTDHVRFDGWQNDVSGWLKDKQFLLSTSMHESFGYGIAEAMAMGIKPVVHNFPFSSRIWPEQILFNTVDEAVAMITSPTYGSAEYRGFVDQYYSLVMQVTAIRRILASLPREKGVRRVVPMFQKGALKQAVDGIVSPV